MIIFAAELIILMRESVILLFKAFPDAFLLFAGANLIAPETYFRLGFRARQWTGLKVIANEARTSAIIRSDVLADKTGIPLQSVRVNLRRQQTRGLVEHVTRKRYINKLSAGFDPRDLAAAISPQSYVSDLDEFELQRVSRSRLLKYAEAYPRVLRQSIYPILLNHQFAT